MKVVDQTEAVTGGHAVRAVYMYSGMADVAALTGDAAYVNALDKIWDNVAGKKLYITGGIGARAAGEVVRRRLRTAQHDRVQRNLRRGRQRFLEPSPVPAARRREVHRRDGAHALQRPDLRRVARRQDVLLPESAGSHGHAGKDQRSPWFGVACCPGNITRFMAIGAGIRLCASAATPSG